MDSSSGPATLTDSFDSNQNSSGFKKIRASMYNFGSPKVGNSTFVQLFDKLIPDSFRVVVDGDIVTGVPPGYSHVGTEILIDDKGTGSIIIDPSFVERWLRTRSKNSVSSHILLSYQQGLAGVIEAACFMRKFADNHDSDDIDPVKLALETHLTMKKSQRKGTLNSDSMREALMDSSSHTEKEADIVVSPLRPQSSSSSALAPSGPLDDVDTFHQEYVLHSEWITSEIESQVQGTFSLSAFGAGGRNKSRNRLGNSSSPGEAEDDQTGQQTVADTSKFNFLSGVMDTLWLKQRHTDRGTGVVAAESTEADNSLHPPPSV